MKNTIKGKYEKKLKNVFLSIAGFCIIVTLLSITLFFNYKSKVMYNNSLNRHVLTSKTLADNTFTTVDYCLANLKNSPYINAWATSVSRTDYYYNSILAHKDIKEISSLILDSKISIAVTKLNDDSFVIFYDGTVTKDAYFNKETFLTPSQLDYVDTFYAKNDGELIIPFYNRDYKLYELYYFYRKPFDKSGLIYMIKIPEQSIFGSNSNTDYIIYSKDELIASSNLIPENISLFETIYASIHEKQSKTNELIVDDKIIFKTNIINTKFRIGYIFDNNVTINYFYLLFISVLSISALSFILYLLFSKLVTWLYKPIKNVISENTLSSNGEFIDEFKIIQENSTMLKDLSETLQNVMTQNNQLQNIKFYRDLLLGTNMEKHPLYSELLDKKARYCVAIYEFLEEKELSIESELFIGKSFLMAEISNSEKLRIINLNYNSVALILEVESIQEAKETLINVSTSIPDEQGYIIALSDIKSGINNVHNCYLDSLSLLEYKYSLYSTKIITKDLLVDIDLTNYSYPIILENKLIQIILDGNMQALDIFDNILRDNFNNRQLSPDNTRNLLYSLLNTINRCFQELKTTPEELLNYSISFEQFYLKWNDANNIKAIRNIIEQMVLAISKKYDDSDSIILDKMKTYIYENFSSNIMLIDVTDSLGITPKYCSNLFKRLSNENFKNFLNEYRIEQAKILLEKDNKIKVTELSTLVGFNSSNSFIRAFSRHTGMTPGAYISFISKDDIK